MVARCATAILSKTTDFVSQICGVVPINLPPSHLNGLRIMNSLLFNTFIGNGDVALSTNVNEYMSSDKYSFNSRIKWISTSYTIIANSDTIIFEQIKKHLLLVEIFASTYFGLNQLRRSLIELNANQYLIKHEIGMYVHNIKQSLDADKDEIDSQIHATEEVIFGLRRKIETINRNMEQKADILASVRDCLLHAENDLAIVESALSSLVPDICVASTVLLRFGKCLHLLYLVSDFMLLIVKVGSLTESEVN